MIEHELIVPQDYCIIEPNVHQQGGQMSAEFGDRLQKALKHGGVKKHGSGAWLHRLTGVTPKAASKWLNGESTPRREKIIQIAAPPGPGSPPGPGPPRGPGHPPGTGITTEPTFHGGFLCPRQNMYFWYLT